MVEYSGPTVAEYALYVFSGLLVLGGILAPREYILYRRKIKQMRKETQETYSALRERYTSNMDPKDLVAMYQKLMSLEKNQLLPEQRGDFRVFMGQLESQLGPVVIQEGSKSLDGAVEQCDTSLAVLSQTYRETLAQNI